MDAIEAIRSRRSIRSFTGEQIPKADLETIVDAGRLAPTGSNLQPWDFILITNQESITHFNARAEWVVKASAIVVIVADQTSRWWIEDCAAATENMLIAATALGYGSCWLEGAIGTLEQDYKDFLGIPNDRKIFTLIALGVPAEMPVKEKKSLDQVLHRERFGDR